MAYKPSEGRLARMAVFWLLFILTVFGCNSLRYVLDGITGPGSMQETLFSVPLIGDVSTNVLISLIAIPAVVAFILYRWLNKPKTADFLIEVEGELRKVAWPSFAETRGASIVVIVCVIVLMFFLFGADVLLGRFFDNVWSWGNTTGS